ncbi:MAG: hypothetical protein GAK28_00230 [Luteibacter sp.]|uniref:hypothetical protein n=1 Tax=Luteibacter sp. TaxID=1886636 RepID=UPI001380FF02|nr:hypothetical protein [Luteibacter sp.]KAF1009590.1 MAG: hypothetical protein GAK28_00230 [Luteibacter sp.]
MQLDVDLSTLRDMTGREPVQLAIDGSSFVPVLADLAADDKVTGTILVDYQDHVMADLHRYGALVYVARWQQTRDRDPFPDFARTEAWLTRFVHHHLRSFADGASPLDSLVLRALSDEVTPQYLVTLPTRERMADYTLVHMPDFYFERVMRNAGISEVRRTQDVRIFGAQLTRQIQALAPVSMPDFATNSQVIAAMVRRIEARGGHVAFIMLPRSGLVRTADERLFPREDYWRPFINAVQAPSLHYADVPSMKALVCPDGSHLDRRARVAFTRDLVHAMPLLSGGAAGNGRRSPRAMPPSPSEHGS